MNADELFVSRSARIMWPYESEEISTFTEPCKVREPWASGDEGTSGHERVCTAQSFSGFPGARRKRTDCLEAVGSFAGGSFEGRGTQG